MTDIRKCKIMPNGSKSVMTFLLVRFEDDTDHVTIQFISMDGWNQYDCEELDGCPNSDITDQWHVAEDDAVKKIWSTLKRSIFT
jgi:hypothetical protein